MECHYLKYELSGDQYCDQEVTGIEPVTYDFYVYCCYFELDKQTKNKLNTHLIFLFDTVIVVYDNMFITITFLLAPIFFTMNYWVTT